MLSRLSEHVLVCGHGRVGSSAVATLSENDLNVVVIDKDEREVATLQQAGHTVVYGDATKDETLKEAGIERARGLVVCTGNDSDNLFIVLSARTLNPDLYIVVRAADSDNEGKMKRAGADRVVSPYRLGGRHMANVLARPHVTEFLDVVNLDSGIELWLEEFSIDSESPLAGRTVIDSDLRRNTGVTLVALLRKSTGAALTPDHETLLETGDQLIVLGTRDQLKRLENLARP